MWMLTHCASPVQISQFTTLSSLRVVAFCGLIRLIRHVIPLCLNELSRIAITNRHT